MLYFDTSFLVPYILPEATSERVQEFFRMHAGESLALSHWTRVEFASMLAREVRMRSLSEQTAQDADARFQATMAASFEIILPNADDFDLCKRYLLRFETGLRVGDAMHLAIAGNHRARVLYSLDHKLLKAARLLGLPAETGIRFSGGRR